MDLLPILLALSTLVLAPALALLAARAPRWWIGFDGFVVTGLVGLVALTVVPHAVRGAGFAALAAVAIGFLLPPLFERAFSHHGEHPQGVALVALLGISVHALMDGAALAGHEHEGGQGLSISVIVHQLPVVMAVWTRLQRRWAIIVLVLMGLGTVIGFVTGQEALAVLAQPHWGFFEAMVGGTLMHVALEPAPGLSAQQLRGWASGLGALFGLAVVAAVVITDDHVDHASPDPSNGEHTIELALLGALPLLVGVLITAWLRWRAQKRTQAGERVLEGWPFRTSHAETPSGSLDELTLRGWNLSAVMVAASWLGPLAGLFMVGVSVIVARLSGLILGLGSAAAPPARQRTGDFFVGAVGWFALGVVLAHWIEQGATADLGEMGLLAQAILLLALALLSLPPLATLPLAALLTHHGAPASLAAAVVIVGVQLGPRVWITITRRHGRTAAMVTIGLGVVCMAGLVLLTPVWSGWQPSIPTGVQQVAFAALAVPSLWLLVRNGPRALVSAADAS